MSNYVGASGVSMCCVLCLVFAGCRGGETDTATKDKLDIVEKDHDARTAADNGQKVERAPASNVPNSMPDADFEVTSEVFQKEFMDDVDAATKKYEGKWVKLSGMLSDPANSPLCTIARCVALQGPFEDKDRTYHASFNCELTQEQYEKHRHLTATQTAVVLAVNAGRIPARWGGAEGR